MVFQLESLRTEFDFFFPVEHHSNSSVTAIPSSEGTSLSPSGLFQREVMHRMCSEKIVKCGDESLFTP